MVVGIFFPLSESDYVHITIQNTRDTYAYMYIFIYVYTKILYRKNSILSLGIRSVIVLQFPPMFIMHGDRKSSYGKHPTVKDCKDCDLPSLIEMAF